MYIQFGNTAHEGIDLYQSAITNSKVKLTLRGRILCKGNDMEENSAFGSRENRKNGIGNTHASFTSGMKTV